MSIPGRESSDERKVGGEVQTSSGPLNEGMSGEREGWRGLLRSDPKGPCVSPKDGRPYIVSKLVPEGFFKASE